MNRTQVVYQTRQEGGGTVWVHRPRGTWRHITFASGRSQLAKVLGLSSALSRIGGATTTVVRDCRIAVRLVVGDVSPVALVPRAGPAVCPIDPQAP